jgi:hypothetical protein
MSLFGWFSRKPADGTRAWREAWQAALDGLDPGAPARLEAALRAEPPLADDLEVEEEMLDALRQVLALEQALATGRPPLVETSHRIVGNDRCHFSAPVSMPDDPAQPTGRLLFTSSRAVFAGGTRAPTIPWHAVRQVIRTGRDVLLVTGRGDDDNALRYRCNSFGEALCAAAIARYLSGPARSRQL